jgi:hypothetical protein
VSKKAGRVRGREEPLTGQTAKDKSAQRDRALFRGKKLHFDTVQRRGISSDDSLDLFGWRADEVFFNVLF